MAERKNLALGPFFLTPLVGSGDVCPAVPAVFDVGLSERLLAALGALPCNFRLGATSCSV